MIVKRWLSPILILSLLIIGTFLAEVVAMTVVYVWRPPTYLLTTLIDAFITVALIFPLCYFLVFRGLVHMIYERLFAERELQKSIKVFESLFSTTHVQFAYLDSQFNFVRVNPAYADKDGRDPDFFPGKNHFDLYPHAENEAIFRQVVETGEPYYAIEKPFVYPENPELGVTYWDWSLEPVKDPHGKVTGLILALIDRTRQKQEQLMRAHAEGVLKANEELLRRVLETMPIGVWIIDRNGNIMSANPAAQDIWGGAVPVETRPVDEFQAWDAKTGVPIRPVNWPAAHTLLTGELSLEREIKILNFDGEEKIILDSSVPILADGEVQSVLVLNIDITERNAASRALELERNKLESILNALPEGVYIAGRDYQIEYINPVLVKSFGLVANQRCYQYFHDRTEPCPWCENPRVFAGESITEEWSSLKTGRTYEIYSTPITNSNGSVSKLKIFHDITERRQNQADLEGSLKELQIAKEAEHRARLTAEVFAAASQAFTQSLEMEAVFNHMLEFIQRLVPYTRAQVALVEDEDRFTVRAGYPAMPPIVEVGGDPYLIATYPHLVDLLTSEKPVLIQDVTIHPGWQHYSDSPAGAWMGVPLFAGSSVIGFLGMEMNDPNQFSAEDAGLAEALVSQASTAIQNAWLFEQVRAAGERLQSLSRHLVDVQESERRHIARELHDESGQLLTSVMVNLQLLEKHADDPAFVTAKTAELGAYLESALKSLQKLAMSLRPATLDHLGLGPALRQLAQNTSERHGLKVLFKSVGVEDRLPLQIETALYRVVQESINNTVRYAQASHVDILLQTRQGKLILIVEDDGVGFNPLAVDERLHSGIVGMRERVETLDGQLTIESEPGRGATVLVELPYDYQYIDR